MNIPYLIVEVWSIEGRFQYQAALDAQHFLNIYCDFGSGCSSKSQDGDIRKHSFQYTKELVVCKGHNKHDKDKFQQYIRSLAEFFQSTYLVDNFMLLVDYNR